MATPQEFLVAFLTADTAFTALVPTAIPPDGSARENAPYPRVSYQVIDWPTKNKLDGPTGYGFPRIQIDIRTKGATGYGDAWAIANAVRTCRGGIGNGRTLDGFTGIFANVDVRRVRLMDRIDEWDPPIHGEEYPVRHIRLDFVVELVE